MYKTYVRPHLEYCAPTWSPYLVKDIDALERVQHHATKLVKSLSILPYEDRFISLQLQSLYSCRQLSDLIETFKILHNFTIVELRTAFTLKLANQQEVTLSSSQKEDTTWNLAKFFTNQVINIISGTLYPVMLFVHLLSTPSNQNLTITYTGYLCLKMLASMHTYRSATRML